MNRETSDVFQEQLPGPAKRSRKKSGELEGEKPWLKFASIENFAKAWKNGASAWKDGKHFRPLIF
jgi:hypothetical protein